MQLLYSFLKRENITLAEIERDLIKSIEKSSDLYYLILLLFTDIRHKAFMKIDAARNRHMASATDLNPNTRFIDNPILMCLESNRKFSNYVRNNIISWQDTPEMVDDLYKSITESDIYQNYMSLNEVSFEDHRKLLLDLFVELFANNEALMQNLEDKNIFWNDDFELVFGIVYKTLKGVPENCEEDNNFLIPVFKSDEDIDFAKTLLRKTALEYNEHIKLIDKFTHNWEVERISDIDKLIMAMAISELCYFPSIPVKVTLDEAIELAKTYSSPKSGSFINGVLDKIVPLLKESGRIAKSGRGLLE